MKLEILLSAVLLVALARGGVDEDFLNPPRVARPYVWWQWMGSNVTDAGIERDVAAMAGAGVGGAVIFSNTAQCGIWAGLTNAVNPALRYRNAEYWRLYRVAAEGAVARDGRTTLKLAFLAEKSKIVVIRPKALAKPASSSVAILDGLASAL